MRQGAIIRDTNSDRHRYNASVVRTVERYEAKKALMAEWDEAVRGGNNSDEARAYLQELRKETTKLRAQLKVKGVIFGDGDGQ